MRTALRSALLTVVLVAAPMGAAAVSAIEPEQPVKPPAPVYGPGATASLTVLRNGGTTAAAQGFCANTPIVFSVEPAAASSELPITTTTDANGVAKVNFTNIAGEHKIVATSTAPGGCAKLASVTFMSNAPATVAPVVGSASATPAAATGAASAGNTLPVTGSDATGMQLRNALVALAAGLGLVTVAGVRRRRTGEPAALAALAQLPTR